MQQLILPTIPMGATEISKTLCVFREEGQCTYYHGMRPVFSHPENDLQQFRLITTQFINSGACRQVDIINIFGVTKSSVARWLRKYRNEGPEAFFRKRPGHRGGDVLTPEVLQKAQQLLNQGLSRSETGKELGVKTDTLRKAIYDGRLQESSDKNHLQPSTTKSERDEKDAGAAAHLGTGCTRHEERTLAAFGMSEGAPIIFEPCLDVPKGGVICALPSLLINGLLDGWEQLLGKLKGYYQTVSVVILVAYMALCRIKTTEQIRSYSPGEMGKLLGLDRVPEVRCLREKLARLSIDDSAAAWAAHLSQRWLQENAETVGTLYIDGHVRVYHGRLTKPPRQFVSRDRLCLRGTTDYWVNDAMGRPFFVVEKPIDPGMIKTLKENIVPRLLKDIPNQPTQEELKDNPNLCRFILVFDREGYSPELMSEMWLKHRIGCITYKKFVGKDLDWPLTLFCDTDVSMPNGEVVTMRLAEMGSLIGTGQKIWVREVRKLTDSGHQTSLISTAYDLPHEDLAARMFSRWCQENFFRYMMRHYAIDLLAEYGADDFPDTEQVVNPVRRELEKSRNSLNSKLKIRRAKFTALGLAPEPETGIKKYTDWQNKKAKLLEEIELFERQLDELKQQIKQKPKHINWCELEDKDKFQRLRTGRKHLIDTIRMVTYRSETAMAELLKCKTIDMPKARQLVLDLFSSEVDILPDTGKNILHIRVHGASRPAANRALDQLLIHLNNTETIHPGTNLKLHYELGPKITPNRN